MDSVSEPPPFDALEDRILPWSQVKVICGLSRTTVWRNAEDRRFPGLRPGLAKPGRMVAERAAGVATGEDTEAPAGAPGHSGGAGAG